MGYNVVHTNISSPMKRFFANLLDSILLSLIGFILLGIAGAMESAGMFLVAFIASWGIQLYFWSKGTSLGKHLMNMQVIKKDTEAVIGLGHMFIRETIGKFLSGLVFSLGYIWILIDKDNQAWHDKFVNSIVVDR